MDVDLDVLGLIAVRRQTSIRFGAVEAGPALTRANTTSAMNKMPDAEVVLDLDEAPTPFDYFSGLVVTARERGEERIRFTGSVVSAHPIEREVTVNAMGVVSLAESLIGGMVSRGIPHFELIHLLTRSGGLREEQLNIEGLDALPRETFEVVAPVDGVSITTAVDFAGVRFLPPSVAARALTALDVGEELRTQFEAPSYALALVTAKRGLALIDLALAWLTVRLRYGLATLPDGRALPFHRSQSLAHPARRDLVAVRALATTRQWLRRPEAVAEARTVDLVPDGLRIDPDLVTLTLQERLAILALARASAGTDQLARVLALFEAIEFYTAGVSVEDLFAKSERKAVRMSLPPTLTAKQRHRIEHLLGDVNNAPLRVRLMQALDDDAVPLDSGELELLWRLRDLRNDVVHGRRSELPAAEDVEYGNSIVARMLVYRVARRGREAG
jgi:hypothetical protein